MLSALTGIVGLGVATIALWPAFHSTSLTADANRLAFTAELSVVHVDVASTVDVVEESWSSADPSGLRTSGRIAVGAAKIVLHNSGEQAALVSELKIHVSKVWAPQGCHGAGPGLTSARYDFPLPGDILDRTLPVTLTKKIDFEVAGKANDRLAVTVGEESLGEAGWPWLVSASAELGPRRRQDGPHR